MAGNPSSGSNPPEPRPSGLSWASMLILIALACTVAGVIAYRLVAPFFPHH